MAFKCRSFLLGFAALAALLAVSAPPRIWAQCQPPPTQCTDFADMAGSGFLSAAKSACDYGLMKPCGANPPASANGSPEVFFCPGEFMTREDMAVSLEKLYWGATFNPAPVVDSGFQDVPLGYCLGAWIKQLASDGITTGCSANPPLFCPYSPVTRWQMAIFLARVISKLLQEQVPTSGYISGQFFNCAPGGTSLFADVLPTDQGCSHIHYIYAKQITLGCGTNPLRYCPGDPVVREQMAAFLVRARQLIP